MNWLGPMFRLMYAPPPDPEIAALLSMSQAAAVQARTARERLERRANREPLDDLADDL